MKRRSFLAMMGLAPMAAVAKPAETLISIEGTPIYDPRESPLEFDGQQLKLDMARISYDVHRRLADYDRQGREFAAIVSDLRFDNA